MESWERDLKSHNIQKAFDTEIGFDLPIEDIIKGKAHPLGTKRVWGGVEYEKKTEGWIPVKKNKSEPDKKEVEAASQWANARFSKVGIDIKNYEITTNGKIVAIQNKETKEVKHFEYGAHSTEKFEKWLSGESKTQFESKKDDIKIDNTFAPYSQSMKDFADKNGIKYTVEENEWNKKKEIVFQASAKEFFEQKKKSGFIQDTKPEGFSESTTHEVHITVRIPSDKPGITIPVSYNVNPRK